MHEKASVVKVYLDSTNRKIHSLCAEVFRDISGDPTAVDIACGFVPSDADLYVWDIDERTETVQVFDTPDKWRHFFLINRDEVDKWRKYIPFQGANILLKPISQAALMAFFADACKRCDENRTETGALEGLRADRDEILQCLMQANLKLQEYDHDRTNFLARAIHDFRAPLTAVTGYCGLLLNEDIGPLMKEQREVLERIDRSAKKLSRMAAAMFQLSIAPRIEPAVDLKRGDIRDVINHALHEIQPAAAEKRLTIAAEVAPCPQPLRFEKGKLEQLLVNLIDNACKFTPRGGSIEVNGYPFCWDRGPAGGPGTRSAAESKQWEDRNPNSYRVDIRDNGPGIPAAHLNKIFEEYTSCDGGGDRSGGGLGLAICRMIVTQHNGRVWAETNADGAMFSFVLPFESAEAAPLGNHAALDALQARAF